MNIKLPKRKDPIYKEIEEFKDYEFTNCIAYEMAIRNKQVIKIFNNEILNIKSIDMIVEQMAFYRLQEDLKPYGLSDCINSLLEKPKNLLGRTTYTTNYNEVEIQESRPKLDFKEITKKAILEINLNLPKNEIIKYLEEIKQRFDDNRNLVKTPLEILGEVFEKSDNKKINKKLIADKFFIYDYITARQEEIKESNEFLYEEYEEEIQEIKNNTDYTVSEKKIQLKEKKKEFEENTNIRINELFAGIEDIKGIEGILPATAKRYYYDIKPFIDDCKYKELITGMKL